ncbi:MAG: hypothetical protein A3A73_00715 [Omnitrophica bacterium RIFCSPLOWO2_01_FULL_50_24]|nr:MAG: hypothetical protein A3A73_00715 [Omnitrophica bacterium RIFCSPLOWO2_01_FULL_50_24]
MEPLTPTQKKAVEQLGHSVCVSAGAGTGKTRVLVERFIHLIEKGLARPEEILAITFTEKAAKEMKERIARELKARSLAEARRQLENAYIGTIHSVCARILREHPCEAGVDPSARILKEDEANLLQETVLERLMEDRFSGAEVFELLKAYTEKDIRRSLKSVANQVHAFGISESLFSSDFLSIQKSGTEESTTAEPTVRSSSADPRRRLLRGNLIAKLDAIPDKEDSREKARAVLHRDEPSWAHIEALQAIHRLFPRMRGKTQEPSTEFRKLLDEWIALEVEPLARPFQKTFLGLAQAFVSDYRHLKREKAALDFNDLERETVRLLGGETPTSQAVRKRYQTQFKFVLVDEFQDTAPLQNELIGLLSGKDNVFIVGDWKQSIYGFRGTDVSLFLEREREAGIERIPLVENFRSRPELLAWINRFFKFLWRGEGERFDALQPKRPSGSRKQVPVDLLVVEQDKTEAISLVRMKEARAVAHRVKQLARDGPFDYKDIAILFRAATDVYFYEHELRALHIPYYVVSGRGFYHQSEIRDVITVLELIENPHLDIPLAAVLRSPLVQVSDDALFWLSRASKGVGGHIPLFRAAMNFAEIKELNTDDQKKLEKFRTWFTELLKHKERFSVSACLDYILARTQYDLYVLGHPEGKRHFANLRKLREIAREVEEREPVHLGDFVRYVKGLETKEVRESEAQVEAEEGNAVKLMTIHKAKGLEFDVVVLPDLGRQDRGGGDHFLAHRDLGLGLRVRNEETREFEDTSTYKRIKEKLTERDEAESKRVLYVAMTRAREHLVLSGIRTPRAQRKKTGWLNSIFNFVEETSDGVNRIAVEDERAVGDRCLPLIETEEIRAFVQAGAPIPVPEGEDLKLLLKRFEPVTASAFPRIDLPATAFSVFEYSRKDFERVYPLGGASSEKIEEWNPEEDDAQTRAAEFGTTFHNLLELLVLQPKTAQNRWLHDVKRAGLDLPREMREELLRLVETFLGSRVFSEIKAAKRRYPEVPFVFRLHSGLVQGTIDLLYQNQKGEWIILDYKTSRVESADLKQEAARYRTQLELYTLAAHELLRLPIARATLYFARLNTTFDFTFDPKEVGNFRSRFESLQREMLGETVVSEGKRL